MDAIKAVIETEKDLIKKGLLDSEQDIDFIYTRLNTKLLVEILQELRKQAPPTEEALRGMEQKLGVENRRKCTCGTTAVCPLHSGIA